MSESSYSGDAFLTSSSSDSAEFDELTVSSKRRKLEDVCGICNQNASDPGTKFFHCLPESAVEEEVALTDDRLLLYRDGEFIPEVDAKPLVKITHFAIYDGEGHLCPFDGELIEREKLLFFSGYLKPIHEDDPMPTGGVPAQELGPILEWWISGFDGGNSFLLGLATPCADYILMEPIAEYAAFMRRPKQKALLTKVVIEFLGNHAKATYEELLCRINEVSAPDDIEPLDEHCLEKYAQFIINQLREIDEKKQLISTPAAQHIIMTYKVKVGNVGCRRKLLLKRQCKPTTTELVRKNFRFFFSTPPEVVNDIKEETFCKKLSNFSWNVGDNAAVVNDEIVQSGDFVYINIKQKARIFRVAYFFLNNYTKQVHCTAMIKGQDTILGDASNPREYFFLEECSNWPICKIMKKATVAVREPPKIWEQFIKHKPEITDTYFVQKTYSKTHAFEDIKSSEFGSCGVCIRAAERERLARPIPIRGINKECDKIIWQGDEYSPGCCVFLEPFCIVFNAHKSSQQIEKTVMTLKVNEIIFPEIYRKAKEFCVMEDCPEPFAVGYIKKIYTLKERNETKLFLTVNKLYRPENTKVIGAHDKESLDLQLLYWSDEEAEVSFDHVRGLCDVVYSKTAPAVGLHPQFYFHLAFDADTRTFRDVNDIQIKRICKNKPSVAKLKTLNPFSGCGGLAEGLRQSGAADIIWAIEIDKVTSKAYKLNFPEVTMFEKNCNVFLAEIMSGKVADEIGTPYPVKGEVEFLCGGPPCQGFSFMNRFSDKEDAQNNNALILTYLSLCDYYRPKFFLLENVRNFVLHKKSVFLKHTLSCLIAMGYQCRLGVLQAGNYGLPQNRRRMFIIAAAPGLPLPELPAPTHVFFGTGTEFEVNGFNCIDDTSIMSCSAPYRRATVYDAIFNLPRIGRPLEQFSHEDQTYYEKYLMSRSRKIKDHLIKDVNPINEARIKHIPASKGCDWRDLPNIQVRLRDGTLTNILKYSHHDKKNGKSCCGMLRGVCRCASGKSCDPKDRQNNTLIPWFLVHTANRNNNWSGLYGRLDWDGAFSTVTTNPEPSTQQGKVLHPEQNRIISVRECARAQGLPDSFSLQGTVLEKFRQVGNAVPPPLARALGCAILNSLGGSINH